MKAIELVKMDDRARVTYYFQCRLSHARELGSLGSHLQMSDSGFSGLSGFFGLSG